MTDHDAAAIARVVEGLVDVFRPYGWNDGSLAGYTWALSDLPPALVELAADDAVRTCERMPAPVELRRLALVHVRAQPIDAGEAWAEVLAAARRLGRNGRPEWSSPLVAAALEAVGGYRTVCDSTNLTAERARFCDTYARLVTRAEREALIAPALAGPAALVATSTALPAPSDDDGDER